MWENAYLRIENPKATDSSFCLHDSTSLCQQLSASEARSPRQNPGSALDHVQKWKIQYFGVEIFQHEDINQDTLIPFEFSCNTQSWQCCIFVLLKFENK